jgi:hypothetical protein
MQLQHVVVAVVDCLTDLRVVWHQLVVAVVAVPLLLLTIADVQHLHQLLV